MKRAPLTPIKDYAASSAWHDDPVKQATARFQSPMSAAELVRRKARFRDIAPEEYVIAACGANLVLFLAVLRTQQWKLVVAIVGLLTSIMAFIVSFLPPDNIQGDSTDMYVELLVVSFLVVLALPFILYAVHDRKGKANTGVTLEPINSQNAPKGHFFLHPRARSPHYIVMNDKKHYLCLNGYKTRER